MARTMKIRAFIFIFLGVVAGLLFEEQQQVHQTEFIILSSSLVVILPLWAWIVSKLKILIGQKGIWLEFLIYGAMCFFLSISVTRFLLYLLPSLGFSKPSTPISILPFVGGGVGFLIAHKSLKLKCGRRQKK